MTRKFAQLGLAAAGLALAAATMTACSDDSTASAPITSNPVTTTSMYQPSSTASTAPSTEASAEVTTSTSPVAGSTSRLPATEPDANTPVPSNFPGPSGTPLSPKAKAYLAELERQDVTFMGDTDNSVALTMAEYVCGARAKGTDPTMIKAFVTGSVGPGTNSAEEAGIKADKVIKAANDHYC